MVLNVMRKRVLVGLGSEEFEKKGWFPFETITIVCLGSFIIAFYTLAHALLFLVIHLER